VPEGGHRLTDGPREAKKFQGGSFPILSAPMVEVVLSSAKISWTRREGSIFRDLCRHLLWMAT